MHRTRISPAAHFPHAKLTVHADNVSVFDEIIADRADVMVTDGIEVDHQALLHKELCAADVSAPFTRLEKAYMLPARPGLRPGGGRLVGG